MPITKLFSFKLFGETALSSFILKVMEVHKNHLNMVNNFLLFLFLFFKYIYFRLRSNLILLYQKGQPGAGSMLGASVPGTGGTGATGTGIRPGGTGG